MMAEDKDKKSGFNLDKGEKRKFNLGKSDNKPKFDLSKSDSKPKFDLSKSDSKSKFDLDQGDSTSKPIINFGKADNEPKPSKPTQSVAKPEVKVGQPTTKSSISGSQDASSSADEAPSNGGSGKKNWIIAAIIIIAIVCAGIWYSNNDKGETTNEPIEQMASDSTANDADSTQTAQSSGGASTPLVGEQGVSDKSTGSDVVPSRDESAGKAGNSVAAGNQAAQQTKTSVQSNAGSEDASAASTDIPSSAREAAKLVWNGKFGNNPQRRRLLGSRYAEIQREVNRMSRAGNIH